MSRYNISVIYASLYIVISFQVVKYIMLNQAWRQFENDFHIFSYFVVYLTSTSVFSLRRVVLFLFLFFNTSCKLLSQFSKVRLCIYVIFVILFSFVLVFCVFRGTGMAIWEFTKHEWDARVAKNFIDVEEYRRFNQTTTRSDSFVIEDCRYREEDIAFTCEEATFGLAGGNPYVEVIWKRNGQLLPSLTRFHQELIITPIPYDVYNHTYVGQPAHYPPWAIFKVTATLKIYHLKFYDFGNYTCHLVHLIRTPDRLEMKGRRQKIYFVDDDRYKDLTVRIERIKSNVAAKIEVDDNFVIIVAIAITKSRREFRLIEIPRKQTTISVPPGAILTFKTRYLHLSESNEEVSAEYFINGQPVEMSLCKDIFHGCSKLFLLYMYFIYDLRAIPPFLLNLDDSFSLQRMKVPKYYQCVCENTYGNHNVYYLRRFYNSAAGKYELLEVRHPDQMVVVPRGQDMLSLFPNRTSHDNEQHLKPPSPQDMHYVNIAGTAVVNEFDLRETIVIGIGSSVFLLTLLFLSLLLKCAGKYAGRFILYQPLPCLRLKDIDRREDLDDAKTKFSNQYFDIFISHVDWNSNLVLCQILPLLHGHGQRVCTSELDIPPNLPILSAVSAAIDNSARYIIILSSEYLNDMLKLNLETDMIGIKAISSGMPPRSSLLVIKLDDCQLLPWMKLFEVHDWTTSLSTDDKLRRLSRWVQRGIKRNEICEFLDICSTSLPLLFMIFVPVMIALIISQCTA